MLRLLLQVEARVMQLRGEWWELLLQPAGLGWPTSAGAVEEAIRRPSHS